MNIGWIRSRRAPLLATVAVAVVFATAGCEWTGLNSLPLPGAEGTGSNSYDVKIQMPNVTTLTQNSPVRVNDVEVGSVSKIEVQGWHALVTVSLRKDVDLPENATAKIGQTSLLGSNHVELAPPKDAPPRGKLTSGDIIPLDRAGVYPTTEQTLSSLSVVLNGGGLAQLQDITRELNNALDGRTDSVRDLLPQLNELVSRLDDQRGQIVAALDGLDRLSGIFAQQKQTLSDALDGIPPALEVLVKQRQNITDAVTSLGGLSDVTNRVLAQSGENLRTDLHNLVAPLEALANTGNHLTDVLSILITFPFSMKNMDHWLKGDYANLIINIDLTGARFDSNFLTGTPLGGAFGGVESMLGKTAGVAGQASDPMHDPLNTAPSPIPQSTPPPEPVIPPIPGITAPLPGVPGR